ncbi:BER1 SRR1-like protein BER1 [Candida maltosa Xu316]
MSDYREVIRNSKLFENIKTSLASEVSTIRCLALGSPSESKNAKYQLALLLELQSLFKANVSIYDPIFNDQDKEILKDFTIEEKFTGDSSQTLYFLPHASLELTEEILNTYKPKYFLANDIIAHTDRLTKKKLADTFPTISILVHLLGDNEKSNDGFTPVVAVSRKKFKEPVIEYNIDSVYFDKVKIYRYVQNSKTDPWGTAFTDLAYHYIS